LHDEFSKYAELNLSKRCDDALANLLGGGDERSRRLATRIQTVLARSKGFSEDDDDETSQVLAASSTSEARALNVLWSALRNWARAVAEGRRTLGGSVRASHRVNRSKTAADVFAQKWSIKAEYLGLGFNHTVGVCAGVAPGFPPAGGTFCGNTTTQFVQKAKVGINYLFDVGPVYERY
jgi:hypothetical protein